MEGLTMKHTKPMVIVATLFALLAVSAISPAAAAGNVTDYKINSVWLGAYPPSISVSVQANFNTGSDPNGAELVGCPVFGDWNNSIPYPSGPHVCSSGNTPGRHVAVQLVQESDPSIIIGPKYIICTNNTIPSDPNAVYWPLDTVQKHKFYFTTADGVNGGQSYKVWVEFYDGNSGYYYNNCGYVPPIPESTLPMILLTSLALLMLIPVARLQSLRKL
jgi:hypothetical protein